ncbi:HEAT repeat domain-containing protein [Amycolatopsis silviterrae]|uniref:HEAT repeat domain-containing protein n=1 Tax=Amycolatopsis silviterrae TaxID=1656914 RepID=A0ABW5H3P8_9PSEU
MPAEPTARELVDRFGQMADDDRFQTLRLLVPGTGDSPVLGPFLIATANDAAEDDLVRVEAIRAIPLLDFTEPDLAGRCRDTLLRLAREDDDWDVRNAAGCAVFDVPGAESSVEPMRAVLAAEPEEFVRDNVSAALNLFLRRS